MERPEFPFRLELRSNADLRQLAEAGAGGPNRPATAAEPRVTIYLPTHRSGAELQQDALLLENLAREAEQKAAALLGASPAQSLCAPLADLRRAPDFWAHQDLGLGLFLSGSGLYAVHLPYAVGPEAHVGERHHVRPLLPLAERTRFQVLALSADHVRLYDGDDDRFEETELGETPSRLEEVVGEDYEQNTLQFRTPTGAPGRARHAMFHGHGAGVDDRKEEMSRFVRRVADGVRPFRKQGVPLVIAAVGRVADFYRQNANDADVLPDVIPGNPELVPLHDLHAQALSLARAHVERERDGLIERVREHVGKGVGSKGLEEVLPAAEAGRIATLLVARDAPPMWGRYDHEANALMQRAEPAIDDEDLLDRAVAQTLTHGGVALALPAAKVPGGKPVAAAHRY